MNENNPSAPDQDPFTERTEYPTCPGCGHVMDEAEDYGQFVTFWGDDGAPEETECGSCDAVFTVREHVTRTFTTALKENKAT